MEGVHVNRIDSNKYTTFRLDHEILHFAPNPYIKSKSCLVTVDNGIHIWDISSNNCVNWKKGGEKSWSTARYGPHPQILYRCDTTNIYASDLRDSASNEILLRESKDQITGLTKHPYEQFQFAFTTNKTTAVMDSRYAKHPILEWKITHGFEHQTHINYLKYPIDDTRNSLVYTWGRYYGDIISYSYDQTDSLPKSVNYQNYTSFKEHSLVKEKFTDEYRYNYIPVCRNIDAAIENSFEHPQWDPLYGVEFFQVNDKLTLLQLTATGELYVQGYKLGVEEDLDESTENRLTEIEESCRAKLRALNSKIKVPKFHAEKKEIPIGKLFTKWQSDLQSSLLELTPVTRKRKYSPKLKLEWPVPEIFTKYEHCEHDNFVKLNIKGDSGASSLPSAYYLFNPDYKEYSLKKLEKDMAEAVQISSNGKFQHDITLYGRPDSHSSSITNPIVGEKKLEGVSSWLLEQWQSDIPFEEIDDSQREQRTVRTKKRDAPLIHSSNRLSSSQPPVVAAKRSLSQSKSVAAINEVQSSRMASSQPVRSHMLVARSRESSSQPVKKPKRKKGF
ncbi:hypothetical protein HK103_000955 [Boothiomyces macroporosus]|uniref:Uncharacterized protein n=1 Tax=Boothiomyces macroporosus TaxID=261099 RepID=A0AAD5Y7C8_9FUNG|nr:hypothetical protein HK103_000955 [Boothiomyces macroporosus]